MGSAGSNIANIQLGGGQARASGYLGQANALNQALQQGAMGYGLYRGGYFGSPGSLSADALDDILPGVNVTGSRYLSSGLAPSPNMMAVNYRGPQYANLG